MSGAFPNDHFADINKMVLSRSKTNPIEHPLNRVPAHANPNHFEDMLDMPVSQNGDHFGNVTEMPGLEGSDRRERTTGYRCSTWRNCT